jgi:type II secretory pathway pseudopilin PulG
MTILEIMIVLAIVGAMSLLVRSGFRLITKADLVENATELAGILKRANQLAIEHGEMHRVVLDFDKNGYVVETCLGSAAIQRNEKFNVDPKKAKEAMERGKLRLNQMPEDALSSGDPAAGAARLAALGGSRVADRTCAPAADAFTGNSEGKGWVRKLNEQHNIKFKELWVQHREDGITKGQEAIYFFPMGSAEKAVIEMTDGTDTFSILVFGLTGRVELRDGPLDNVDDHMLRDAMGKKQMDRDAEEVRQ